MIERKTLNVTPEYRLMSRWKTEELTERSGTDIVPVK